MVHSENFRIGFVFDLDGTLINSTDIGDIAAKEIFQEFDIQMTAELQKEIDELTYKIIAGENSKRLSTKVMWAIFIKLGLSFIERIKALKIAAGVFKRESKKIKLYEGVPELFRLLDEKSYPYTIATTSSKKEVDSRLTKFPDFYEKLEGKIITRSDVQNLKPNSESIMKASEIMNIPLNHIVMVGDMHTDIMMGQNVGAITVGVLTGMFSKEQLKELNPDFIINVVSDLKDILEDIKKKMYQ